MLKGLIAGSLLATSLALGSSGMVAAAPAAKPNIVFIMVDDLDAATAALMPQVRQRLGDEGTTFDRAYTQYALCSPSRATALTGRYAQNTNVRRNKPTAGGFQSFVQEGNHTRSVNIWLKSAGYRTGMIGKFINSYPSGLGGNQVLPGWDYWAVAAWSKPYDYRVNENGRWVSYGDRPADYDTDVYRDKALGFIGSALDSRQPFALFLWFGQVHSPFAGAPRHRSLFRNAIVPRTPAFNEADMSDKPRFLQPALLTAQQVRSLDGSYGERLRATRAIDEAVEAIYATLQQRGALQNTYIVFTSDNGFHTGEHRLTLTKGFAFEESIRVPLLVRGPGVAARRKVTRLVGNADFAPTFAAWAGITPPVEVDGRSFAPLLTAADPTRVPWRRALPLSKLPEAPRPERSTFVDRLDPRVTRGYGCIKNGGGYSEMRGVRTERYTFAHWAGGDLELYDNARDPHQLDNAVCSTEAGLRRSLSSLAAALSTCRGATCRTLEDTGVP